jgi:MFS family permease
MQQREEKKKALKYSIIEGSASSASASVGDSIITPFALKIVPEQFSNIYIGVLSSLSLLLSQIVQSTGSKLIKKHPRKSIVVFMVLMQAIMWLAIGSLAIMRLYNILTGVLPIILIILYSIISLMAGLYYPAWFSWMGDLIPDNQRGAYFSKRNIIVGIIGLSIALLTGIILDRFEKQGILLIGFAVLFSIAFIFRVTSYVYLKKQYAVPGGYKKEKIIDYTLFKNKYKNFYKFSIYLAWFNFAIMFASPFFAVYMLKEIGFDYKTYMLVSVSSTAFYLLFLRPIGKFSDKYGNLKLLYLANIAFVFSPIAWTFTRNPMILIIIPQIISGLANAALTISVVNFSYASISKHHRAAGISYSNILVGLGTFSGALLGGLTLNFIPINFMNKFIFIFFIAATLRFLVAFIFLPQIKEARLQKHIHPWHINLSAPFKFISYEAHQLNAIGRKSFSQGLKVLNTD